MASKQPHIIQATSKGFKKTGKDVKSLSSSMKTFAVGLLSAAAAYKAFSVGLESIKLAGKLEGVENAFNNMRKEAGFSINTFSKLDKALNGTADRMTIMTQANNAMLLGIADSEEQMAEMFDVAQRLAEAVGQDATFGIESLVTGLGRQSKLMLDNLGIMVDTNKAYEDYAEELGKPVEQLTDAEKKQGFVNAAMEQGKELVDGLGEETDTTARKLDRFTTSITDFKEAVGEALISSGVIDGLTGMANLISGVVEKVKELRGETVEYSEDEKIILAFMTDELSLYNQLEERIKAMMPFKEAYREEIERANFELNKSREFLILWMKDFKEAEAVRLGGITTIKTLTEVTKEYVSIFTDVPSPTDPDSFSMLLSTADQNALSLIDRIRELMKLFDEDWVDDSTEDWKKNTAAIEKNTAAGFAAASGSKTMGQAALDASKSALTAYIREAIAGYLKDQVKFFAWMPPPLNAIAIAGAAATASTMFEQQISRVGAQTGFEGVVSEPTQFTVGEGGADEYVSVTPLEGVNNAGGGQGITVNISGNVMSDQFVEEELAERIQEAVRKGVDFGIS